MTALRARSWAGPAAVGLAALLVFRLTLAPSVTAEDSGELIAAAWHFGVPHPPGYPLWTMLCGLFLRAAPILSISARANLFSALCSAGAAMLACAALRDAGLCKPAAAAAALCWIWSRCCWSQSVITEVYALNALLTAALLGCAVRWQATRSDRPLRVASLLLGLGMSNHHTIGLAGLALVAWILILAPGLLKKGRLILSCAGLFLLGLMTYAYLPLRASADPAINWGDPSTPQRFMDHVSRSQYGAIGPMKTAEPRSLARLGRQLAYFADSIRDDMTVPLLAGAILGLLVMVRRARRYLLLAVLWIACTGVLFVVLANYDLDRTSRWAMRVFFIPVSLGLAVPLGFLLDRLLSGLRSRIPDVARSARSVLVALVLAVPMVQLGAHWSQCDYSRYWYAHDHAENILACLLPNAMVFPVGDHNAFPLVYLVMVEGRRPDVLIADIYGYLSPELYHNRPPDSPEPPETWLINRARRPVYYATKKAPPVGNASFVAAGLLYHLLPAGMPFESQGLLDQCRYRNLQDSAACVLDLGACHILADFEFFSGLHELERGAAEVAKERFGNAARYGQGIKEVFNNLGSALAEYGLADDAVAYFQEAARLDGRYALPRWNLFRLFNSQARWEDAHRQLAEIIQAAPADFHAHGEMGFLLRDRLNDPGGAVDFWMESLRQNPDQPQILEALHQPRQDAP